MSRHLAYRRLFEATHELRVGADMPRQTPDTPCCACCYRRWSEVEMPFQAVEYCYGKSGEPEWVCVTCYTPRLPSERMLGLERYNKTGNTTTPIYGKLGMLVGSGGFITPRNELYLTLPPKLHAKYLGGEWGQQGRLSTDRPLARLLDLLSSGALSPIEQGFVYVENWGRKVDVLMHRFQATTSLQEVWCNSEQGVTSLDLQAMLATAAALKAQGLDAQADRTTFWKPVTDAAQGRRDASAFEKWLNKVPDPRALLSALPADPFDRLLLPAVLREVMPRLEALQAVLPESPPDAQQDVARQEIPEPRMPVASRQGSLF